MAEVVQQFDFSDEVEDEDWAKAFLPGQRRSPQAGTVALVASHRRPVPSGPIGLFHKILTTWRLRESDAIALLGLEPSDKGYVCEVLAGRAALRGRDANDRVAYLIQLRMALFAWLRNETEENHWLREPQAALDGQVPMELLLEGSMENLLLVKEYVEAATGW